MFYTHQTTIEMLDMFRELQRRDVPNERIMRELRECFDMTGWAIIGGNLIKSSVR